MDPLCHTLVGASLARSGLCDKGRFAAAALVLGANLPDIDGVTYLVSGELGLDFRRGWTHGVPAILLWPFLLAGALVAIDRVFPKGPRGERRARFRTLLPLSLLAVATHPALDWLNNYGMRWLMPFENRWFYGDAVFIVDPWIWLALGGTVFLGKRKTIASSLGWLLVGLLTTTLVIISSPGTVGGKALFVAGVTAFLFLRWKGRARTPQELRRWNRASLALVTSYIVALVGLSAAVRTVTREELVRQGLAVESLMVGPVPMTPFVKDVVVATEHDYRYGTLVLWPKWSLELASRVLPRPPQDSIVARALARPEVRGFASWARFPWGEVEDVPGGVRVYLADARYVRERANGFGSASVFLEDAAPDGR